MNIAILGLGSQGQAAYKYWNTPEHTLTICDEDEQAIIPEGALSHLGPNYLKQLDQFDLLVRTPRLHPREIVAANPESADILQKVTTVTNELVRVCPSRNIIGVTGTKGKGTTSTLIAEMLKATGNRVHLGGNIGIPPLDMLQGAGSLNGETTNSILPEDWVVLELANFQLIDFKYSTPIAVCLMVEPEHLDWHEDFEEYVAAKQQLFMHQDSDSVAIYYGPNEISESIASASEGTLIPYYESPGATIQNDAVWIDGQELCKTSEIKLPGKHNWQNICAAVTAVWQVSKDAEAIRSVLTTLSGLPFRIELRRELDGIRYYNDSFATAPGASIAAFEAITGPKVMILGGHDRGLDLTTFAATLAASPQEIRQLLLIGASASRIAEALKAAGITNLTVSAAQTMPEIIAQASAFAEPGDAVVLSPAFASFDMFKNFEERGIKFNDAVAAL